MTARFKRSSWRLAEDAEVCAACLAWGGVNTKVRGAADGGPLSDLLSTKIGIRGGREIARGLFCACLAVFALGLVLLVVHASIGKVVVGVLLIVAAVAVVIRYSNKRVV
jgi:hypothetical protein